MTNLLALVGAVLLMDLPVEVVVKEQPERLYDREALLGRDAASVFSSLRQQPAADYAATLSHAAPRFVTEAQLEELKQARGGGGSVEDGSVSADKPLHEVLRENKEKKEAEFQERWRLMKQGGNKPLEEDESAFLDTVAQRELAQQRIKRAEEARELESFQVCPFFCPTPS